MLGPLRSPDFKKVDLARKMAKRRTRKKRGGSSKASQLQDLPPEVLTLILTKATLNLKELLQVATISKAFKGAARGVTDVKVDIKCMNCASSEDCNLTKAYARFLVQAHQIKGLQLKVEGRTCKDCRSFGHWHNIHPSDFLVTKWIEFLRDSLEAFSYQDAYAIKIGPEGTIQYDNNELTFTDLMLEGLSACSKLKRLELDTRKLLRQGKCSEKLSVSKSLLELDLDCWDGTGFLEVLNRCSLPGACPFLHKLSLGGRGALLGSGVPYISKPQLSVSCSVSEHCLQIGTKASASFNLLRG